MKVKLRVGIDLDGCNVEFHIGVEEYLKVEGLDLKVSRLKWNFFEEWGWDVQKFKDFYSRGVDAGVILNNPPYPGAVDTWRKIKALGHDIVVITDRSAGSTPKVSEDLTKAWLDKWGFKYDEIHFTKNKLIVPTDIFVEDKLENYDELEAAGVLVCLITRPWNKQDDSRFRIEDMIAFGDVVESVTNFNNKVQELVV